MNFTDCELKNSSPFRLCTKCLSEYTKASKTFEDLFNKPELEDCRIMYVQANRIQVIPTIHDNIQKMWKDSECKGCTTDVQVDEKTNEVSFEVPDPVAKFMLLYDNYTFCIEEHTTDMTSGKYPQIASGNNQTVCELCKTQYDALRDHYADMSSSDEGKTDGLCMDIVDMMNYTRHNWSMEFSCSHRSGDALPVVLTTTVILLSPLFFYGILKFTGKERKKELFRQKRLMANVSIDKGSFTFAAGDSMGGNRLRSGT